MDTSLSRRDSLGRSWRDVNRQTRRDGSRPVSNDRGIGGNRGPDGRSTINADSRRGGNPHSGFPSRGHDPGNGYRGGRAWDAGNVHHGDFGHNWYKRRRYRCRGPNADCNERQPIGYRAFAGCSNKPHGDSNRRRRRDRNRSGRDANWLMP